MIRALGDYIFIEFFTLTEYVFNKADIDGMAQYEVKADTFLKQKAQSLTGVDLSRKGSIDEPIANLVQYINNLNQYFTTSSCSGRTIIFEEVRFFLSFFSFPFFLNLRGPPRDNFRPNHNLPSYSLAEDIMPRQLKTHHWF